MAYQVFICYRNENAGDVVAKLLHDTLCARGYEVFFAPEALEGGMFNKDLYKRIEECEDVIVVLPPNGLERSLKDEDDWVRIEIAHALACRKNIIPYMIGDFVFPKQLPRNINDIQFCQGVNHDIRLFDAVISEICRLLKSKPVNPPKTLQKAEEKQSPTIIDSAEPKKLAEPKLGNTGLGNTPPKPPIKSWIKKHKLLSSLPVVALLITIVAVLFCFLGGCNPTPADKIYGLCFSPYKSSQSPNEGDIVSEKQFKDRLDKVAPYVEWIRTYGSAEGGLANAGKAAHAAGLKIAQGCWLSEDKEANMKEINNLVKAAKAGYVDIAIVGSETLLRGDLTELELLEYINTVRQQLPAGVLVTTAEPGEQWLGHPELFKAVDVVFANYYAYFEGLSAGDSISGLESMYNNLVNKAGGKEVVISETGFPSAGASNGAAVPSAENAAEYFVDFVEWANSKNVKYFYFEAYDEKWKTQDEGDIGDHWGIFTARGKLKPGMIEAFETGWQNGAATEPAETSTGSAVTTTVPAITTAAPGSDIVLGTIPPKGSGFYITGKVNLNIDFSQYRVVLYILVDGNYWIKPTAAAPLTVIDADGEFSVKYNTGGNDYDATEFDVFVVPKDYSPPLVMGEPSLPEELSANAIASVVGVR